MKNKTSFELQGDTMYNKLFSVGPVTIYGYGLMIGIGVMCGFLIASRRAKSHHLDPEIALGMGIISLVFGMIGAKLLYCLIDLKAFLADPAIILSSEGFVVYGGIIGGVLCGMLYSKIKKVKFLQYFDLLMPSVAVAQGFGRLGCFLAGCCYGRETDSFIGIVFHNSSYAPNGVKLLPTQLISSAGDFAIAAILIFYARKTRSTGKVGALYVILYSIGRFFIEFFRNDYRGSFGALSTSQAISLFTVVIGVLLFFSGNLIALVKKQKT